MLWFLCYSVSPSLVENVYTAHYCATHKMRRIMYVYGRERRTTSPFGHWNHTTCESRAWNYLSCFAAACRHARQSRSLCAHFNRNAYIALLTFNYVCHFFAKLLLVCALWMWLLRKSCFILSETSPLYILTLVSMVST